VAGAYDASIPVTPPKASNPDERDRTKISIPPLASSQRLRRSGKGQLYLPRSAVVDVTHPDAGLAACRPRRARRLVARDAAAGVCHAGVAMRDPEIIETELMEISAIADDTLKLERIIAWCASHPDEVPFVLHQFMGRRDKHPSQTSKV
jgi:hypothetical protein